MQIFTKLFFQFKKRFLKQSYYLCEFLQTKVSIISLLNDLGINKVPKQNKNKNNTFQILENIILNQRVPFWIWEYSKEYMNWNQLKKNIFEHLLILQYIRLCGIERFFIEFWLSEILPVAHSLSGCSINGVLQLNGSFYSEAVYPLWTTKEFFRYMKFLKWNSYGNSKVKFIWSTRNSNNKSLKNTGRAYQNYFANILFKSFGC
jgi:hypothetical protein